MSRKRPRSPEVHYRGTDRNAHIGDVPLTQDDMDRLVTNAYLSDNIVDFMSHRLLESLPVAQRDRVHIYPAAFFRRLRLAVPRERWADVDFVEAKCRETGLSRWTKRLDIFSVEWLFVPMERNEHWTLLVVHLPMRCRGKWGIYFLCSLGGEGADVRMLLRSYLSGEFLAKKVCVPDVSAQSWRQLVRRPVWSGGNAAHPDEIEWLIFADNFFFSLDMIVARQHNGFDCCLYMHEFMSALSTAQPHLEQYLRGHTCRWSDFPLLHVVTSGNFRGKRRMLVDMIGQIRRVTPPPPARLAVHQPVPPPATPEPPPAVRCTESLPPPATPTPPPSAESLPPPATHTPPPAVRRTESLPPPATPTPPPSAGPLPPPPVSESLLPQGVQLDDPDTYRLLRPVRDVAEWWRLFASGSATSKVWKVASE